MILGIVTMITAIGIKKSLVKQIEKTDYMKDIDNQINNLRSYYNTLMKDPSLYSANLLQNIDATLEEISISYETILPRKVINEINQTRKLVSGPCLDNLEDVKANNMCIRKLNTLCIRLGKVKKTL